MNFIRGKSPKSALEIGIYHEISEWWSKKISDSKVSWDGAKFHEDPMRTITMKFVDVLRKNDDSGWCRNDSHKEFWEITGSNLDTAGLSKKYQYISIAVDMQNSNVYIKGETKYTPELLAGNLIKNPSDIMSNLILYVDIMLELGERKAMAELRRCYESNVNDTLGNLYRMGISTPEIHQKITSEANKILKNKYTFRKQNPLVKDNDWIEELEN